MYTYGSCLIAKMLLLAGAALAIVLPATARAAGVNAGTLIENTATATFKAGSQTGTITSNKVVLKVDELLNVTVASLAGSEVVLRGGEGVLAFSVTNSGNGPEAFRLGIDGQVSGNAFVPQLVGLAIDSNDNGTYEPGSDQLLGASPSTAVIAPDGSVRVFVIASIPDGVSDAQLARVQLTASAVTGTGAPGTSFAGKGEGAGDAVVGLTTATGAAIATVRASLASVSLVKSATVRDPFGGTSPIPGAKLTYQLVAAISGTGVAEGLEVRDNIPAGTTYLAGSLQLDGASLSDGADSDVGEAGSEGIKVIIGDAHGGTMHTVNFTVQIN